MSGAFSTITIQDEGGYDPRVRPGDTAPLTIHIAYQEVVDTHVVNYYCGRIRAVATLTCATTRGMDVCRQFTFAVRLYLPTGIQPTPYVPATTTPWPTNYATPITPTPTVTPLPTATPLPAGVPTPPTPSPTPVVTITPQVITHVQRGIVTLANGQIQTLTTAWVTTGDPCLYVAQATADNYADTSQIAQADCDSHVYAG